MNAFQVLSGIDKNSGIKLNAEIEWQKPRQRCFVNGKKTTCAVQEEEIYQGDKPNVLNKVSEGIRSFLGWDPHKYDYIDMLAVTEHKSLSEVYKELAEAGFRQALPQRELEAIIGAPISNLTFGLYPDQELVPTGNKVTDSLLAVAKGAGELAGFIATDAMLVGGLRTVGAFMKAEKLTGIADKLKALTPYAKEITFMRNGASVVKDAISQAGRLGVLTGLVNLVGANEKTNNIWQAVKDVEPEVFQNALFGAGLPFVSLAKSPINRIIFSLALGNASSFITHGKTDLQGIIDGIQTANPYELTNSMFNTLLNVYFGYVAHAEKPMEDEHTQAMREMGNDIENYSKPFYEMQSKEPEQKEAQPQPTISDEDMAFVSEIKASPQDEAISKIKSRAEKEGVSLDISPDISKEDALIKYFDAREKELGVPSPTKLFGGIPLSEWKKPFEQLIENHTLPTVEKDISKITFALVDPFHAQYVVDSPEGRELFKALNKAIETTEEHMYEVRKALGDKLEALREAVKPLDKKTYKTAKEAIYWADKHQKDPMEFVERKYPDADKEALKRVFDRHYDVYKYILERYRKRADEAIKKMKEIGVKDSKIEFIKKTMYPNIGELDFYMARVRKPGNLIVNAYKDGKRIYSKPISDVFTLVFPNRSVVAKHYEKILKERYGDDIEIEVKYPRQKLDVSKLDIFSVFDAIHEALTELPKDQAKAVVDKLIENLKAQGFVAHSIRRKPEVVEGYEEDPFRAINASVSMFTGYLEKQYLRDELMEIRKAVSPRTPNLYKAINNVIDELLRQKDAADRIVNTVRGLLFVKYLGLSLRNGFVNVTFQPIFTGMHLAAEYGKGTVLNYAKAQAELAKAMGDYLAGNLTEKERRVMEKLDEWGVTKAQKTHYMLAKSALNDSLWWNTLTSAAGIIMEKTEQFNRGTAALAFIRTHGRTEELTINELATLAKEFVYLTNGKYGDSNLPMMFQGKGEFKRWARIGQTFQTYNHQQLLGMLKLWKEGHKGALAAGIGLLMLLGGMSTLPMYETVKSVYREVTGGRDMEIDLANQIGRKNFLWDILNSGVIGTVFGIDVTSSASLSMPTDELKFMGDTLGDKMANLVFGVGYQSVKDMFKATKYMAKGDWYKAFYYGIPARFLTYPIKALQEYRVGITSSGDLQFIDPVTEQPLKLTEKEFVLQMLGFTPERISNYKNLIYTFKTIDAYFSKRKTILYNKYRLAKQRGDYDAMSKIARQMMELNAKIARLNSEGYSIAPLRMDVKTLYENKRMLQFMQKNLQY